MRRLILLSALALSACATADLTTSVRHVPSNTPYGDDGARMHLFVFDPTRPRSLDDRKSIARRAIRREPGCRWVDAPDEVLIAATRAQGARYADTLLVAPLICRRT